MILPRLELMAIRILAQLIKSVKGSTESYAKIRNCCYWLDSTAALKCVQNKGEWKNFVQLE